MLVKKGSACSARLINKLIRISRGKNVFNNNYINLFHAPARSSLDWGTRGGRASPEAGIIRKKEEGET